MQTEISIDSLYGMVNCAELCPLKTYVLQPYHIVHKDVMYIMDVYMDVHNVFGDKIFKEVG